MKILHSIVFASRLKVAAVLAVLAALGLYLLASNSEPVYDALVAARRPLVIISGQTQQLPTTDYLSTIGGLTTNATAATTGNIQTTTLTASSGITNAGQTIRSGVITPTLGASESNYNPAGLATASQIDCTLTENTILTGLMAQPIGTEIVIRNTSPAYTLQIANDSGSSDAANQFDTIAIITLQPYQTLTVRYTGSRWTGVGWGGSALGSVPFFDITHVANFGQTIFTPVTITDTGTTDTLATGYAAVVHYTGVGAATFNGTYTNAPGKFLIIQNQSGYSLTIKHNTGSLGGGYRFYNKGERDLVLPPADIGSGAAAAIYVFGSGGGAGHYLVATTEPMSSHGTITLAVGTGTATVLSGEICTCTDTTAANVVQCAVSSTTLTATGTGTDVIAYTCL